MRIDKSSLFSIILLETFILFCLGVLGSRVASLIYIPTPTLILLSAIGIVLAAKIAYVKQSRSKGEEQKALNISFIVLNRLSLKKLWLWIKSFNVHFKDNTEFVTVFVSYGAAFIYGSVGAFIWEPGPGSTYSLLACLTILITFIPVAIIVIRGSAGESFFAHTFNLVCILFTLSAAVTCGMAFDIIVFSVLRILGIK